MNLFYCFSFFFLFFCFLLVVCFCCVFLCFFAAQGPAHTRSMIFDAIQGPAHTHINVLCAAQGPALTHIILHMTVCHTPSTDCTRPSFVLGFKHHFLACTELQDCDWKSTTVMIQLSRFLVLEN